MTLAWTFTRTQTSSLVSLSSSTSSQRTPSCWAKYSHVTFRPPGNTHRPGAASSHNSLLSPFAHGGDKNSRRMNHLEVTTTVNKHLLRQLGARTRLQTRTEQCEGCAVHPELRSDPLLGYRHVGGLTNTPEDHLQLVLAAEAAVKTVSRPHEGDVRPPLPAGETREPGIQHANPV